jgi:hypothetical protein
MAAAAAIARTEHELLLHDLFVVEVMQGLRCFGGRDKGLLVRCITNLDCRPPGVLSRLHAAFSA